MREMKIQISHQFEKCIQALAIVSLLLCNQAYAQSELADAVMNQDFNAIQSLLEEGTDVDEAQEDGSTALHWAVYWGNDTAVEQLIKAGVDVEASTRLEATPLYIAAVEGDESIITILLNADADPNQSVLENDEKPLMFAARSGNVNSVKALLDAGADTEAVESFNGTTALLWAAEHNQAEVVSLLLEHGANANARSSIKIPQSRRGPPLPRGGLSALILASRENAVATVKVLLDSGALFNQQSAEGHTALLVATQNGHHEIASLLIEAGADVNLTNDRGWNPLYMAVKVRSLEKGTMPNPVVDFDEMFSVIKLLVENGANINSRLRADTEVHNSIRSTWLREAGATPFLRAALCGDLEVMEYLLSHDADPLIATSDGTTALMALAGVGYTKGFMKDVGSVEQSIKAMQILIEAGIDLNAQNTDEVAAIHGAAHKNFVEGIQLLVDHGADLTLNSNRKGQFVADGIEGNTVLDWADGFQTGMESAIYNAEAVVLVEKLLVERDLPLERLSGTVGGNNVALAQ